MINNPNKYDITYQQKWADQYQELDKDWTILQWNHTNPYDNSIAMFHHNDCSIIYAEQNKNHCAKCNEEIPNEFLSLIENEWEIHNGMKIYKSRIKE